MGKGTSLSLCAFIVIAVLWTPAQSNDACNVGCKGSAGSPAYLNGHKYTYAVEGIVEIFLTTADKQQTSAKLNAQVTVAALGNCGHVLRVNNLQISGPNGKKYGKPVGIEKPVRFTFQDGRVGAEICSEAGDNQRSLNIKRAIISLLQSEQKPATEVDVFGVCPTEATSSREGGALLVHRLRDLTRCAHRERGKHDFITSIYNPKAEIKSTNILQSSLNVESKVKNGIPEKVSATEEYLYTPFSVGQNGARGRVVTKLTLTGQSAGVDAGAFKDVKSIIFENPHPVNTEHSNQAGLLLALKSAAQSLQANAGVKSAGIFAQLVRIFRVTNKEDLLSVYSQIKAGGAVKDNDLAKKVFLDALVRAGTGETIEAAVHLVKTRELSTFEEKLVYLSLGNARHASSDAVKAAAGLLDLPNLPKEVYLGVGALAGTYCREHECHGTASQSPGVAALDQKFAAKLGNGKPRTKIEEDNVVAVLKGIRNVRHIENSLADKLAHIVADKDVKARVKVAALEAFHADSCTPKLKKVAIDTMKNVQLDSEIRIKAYLALIDCPCTKGATEIKKLLESEPVHQVGRFISSSLRFIRASANPDRELARQHFGQISTPQKFNVDDRKYSHFREFSYNIDSLGLGATAEQTVIFSQDSFLPRSASLNLTTEIFGHSLNVLELGVRQGNLDRVAEHFFGPKGYFKTHKAQEIYDTITTKISDVEEKVGKHLRGRRAVQQEIANFAKTVKGDTTGFDDELDLDVIVKLFGTDAIFLSLGDDQGFSFEKFIEKLLKQSDAGISQLKSFSHEFRSHLLFLDAELTYPTAIGLPLKLNLVGSATGRVEYGGSIDIPQITKDPRNAKFDIKIVPSTNIEVSGTFTVDADVISTGLKVVSNLYTSTGGHLIAKVLENGHGFDLQFGLPVDKQELLTVTNDLVFVTNEKGQQDTEVALKFGGDRKEYTGCFDQLSSVIGLTFCGDLSVPFAIHGPEAGASFQRLAARYPLTGPSKLSVFLEKDDLKSYHFKGLLREEGPKKHWELVFEAEGTKSRRRTALTGEYVNSDSEKSAKISLESPFKTAAAEVTFTNKEREYSTHVHVQNDADEYDGRVGFTVSGNAQRSVYTPLIEYKLPGQDKKTLQVEGQIVRESQAPAKPGNKFSFNGIKINVPNSDSVQIDGYIANELRGFSVQLKAIRGEHRLSIIGALDGQKANLEFQNTLNTNVNFKTDLYTVKEDGHVQNDFNIVYGSDLSSQTNRLSFSQNLKYHYKTPQDFDIITKNHIAAPGIQIDVKADGEFNPKKVDIDLEANYQGRKAELELEARTEIKKRGDYSVKFEAGLDDKGVEFLSKRDIVSDDKSNFENILSIKPGGKYELSGVVHHKFKPQDVNAGAVGHIKIAGKPDDFKFDFGVISNPTQYSSHSKISAGATELLNFLLKMHRGSNPNGQLVLSLKDTVAANGQFQVNDHDGKGHGVFIVDFKRLSRKIKADLNFVKKAPQYNANVDIFLDFEKDNSNKIHFSTVTVAKEGHIDSRNELVVGGAKTSWLLKADGTGTYQSGKYDGLAELVLPNERFFAFKINREVTENNKIINGHIDVSLSDAPKRGAAASTLSYKGKLTNLNEEKQTINYEGQLSIALNTGRNLVNSFSLKNNPVGDRKSFEFKSDVTGNLLPKPASFLINSDYKISEHLDLDEKYRIKGSYGSDISFVVDGMDEIQVINAEDKKYLDQYTVQVNLPFDKAHDIKITSNTMFLIPKDKEIIVEYNLAGGVQVNADVFKVDAAGKIGATNGFSKVKIMIPRVDPFSLDTSYKSDVQGERKSGGFEIKSTYGKGKSATVAIDAARLSANEYSLDIKAAAPQAEKLKKLEISIKNKNPDGQTASTHVVVDADGKIYKLDALTQYSRTNPLLDIKYTCPDSPKPSRIFAKATNINEQGGKVDIKIENVKEFDFDMSVDARTQRDSVSIKIDIDSPKLKLVKYHTEISSKESGHGKRLEFLSTNNGQNVLSGSTSYVNKQEGSKTIVEGSGSVKVRDEQKSANFKYIRDILTEGPEQGVEEFMNIVIGDRSIVLESRVTNLEYKISNVYCEEKKQCAHADLNSKINIGTQGLLQHTLNIGLDLRKLGFSPEFGLQMSSEVGEHKLPQYTLDVHLKQEQNKYHLHAYSQPKTGAFPAGVTLTLPKRVIALESTLTYPDGKPLPFPIKGEAAFWLNKNQAPAQKAAVRLLIDVTGSSDQHGAVAELGFSHPALSKEALLKFKGTFQQPSDKYIKVETSTSFSHPAFGAERESKALFEVSPQQLKLVIRSPLVELVNVDGRATIEQDSQKADLTFVLLQGRPVDIHFSANNYQSFEFTSGYRDHGGKLSVVGHIEPEKRVDISTDLILPSEKKNLFKGALFIQDNLVKSDYGGSLENFKYFSNAVKTDAQALGDRVKQLAEQARARGKADFDRGSAMVDKLAKSYKKELEKLRDELVNDEDLQKINKMIHSIVHLVATVLDEVIQHTSALVEGLNVIFKDTYKQISDMYEQKVAPQLKELFDTISHFVQTIANSALEVFSHFAALIQNFFEKHKAEFQELTNTVGEIFKDLTRLLVIRLKEIRKDLIVMYQAIAERIQTLPVVEMLKEKLAEFTVPDQVVVGLQELTNALKAILPTDESKNLVDAVLTYVTKKLQKAKVDDQAEIRVIYEKLAAAFSSLVTYFRGQFNEHSLPSLLNFNLLRFSPTYQRLPTLGAISFSPLNYLRNGEFPSPLDLIRAYRPRSLNPLEQVPATLYGVVANGQHIFTFDGRHLTFPGTCRYVLALDHADGNFSIVLQLNKGVAKSIILTDKSGSVIELKENGQVALNNANHGFPVKTEDSFAFRTADGILGLGTTYGAFVFCSPKLTVCRIEVNGYYLGKLRGLLGDGNNEEFDDFRLPNGKIATGEAEFGNAYRLAGSCPQVKTPEHGHHGHHGELSEACEVVFGAQSPLRALFLLQDPRPFRQACAHATAANAAHALEEACDIGRAFVAKMLPVMAPAPLPSACVKCDGDGAKTLGDSVEVQVPKKQADIVVAIETTKGNEHTYKDLVVPIVEQIGNILKSKKIDDLKVYLVGITSEMPYPIFFDTDNVKSLKGAKPWFTDASRYNHLFKPITLRNLQADQILEQVSGLVSALQIEFGITNVIAGYNSLHQIPFRPSAVKTVISVVSETCRKAVFPFQDITSSIYSMYYRERGIITHVISVTRDLKIGGGKPSSQVIGYDKSSVLILGDKKHGKDSQHLRDTIETEKDNCADFAEKTGGYVFSASNHAALNAGQRKQFVSAAAHGVVDKLLRFQLESSCRCMLPNAFAPPRNVCLVTSRKEVARRR